MHYVDLIVTAASLLIAIQGVLLLRKVGKIMATLAELNSAIDAVATGVDGLEAAIADLKAQLAAGSPVTQADLDALFDKVQAIGADIADASDQG
jgi:uncharacterized protein YoxC